MEWPEARAEPSTHTGRVSVDACFGTTHADYFHGPIPVTESMSDDEIDGEYEANTGLAIIRAFKKKDPMTVPAVLVANHGPFAWGTNARKAAEDAWMLEAGANGVPHGVH
jgi:L-ribulose-5-phosphate 4-epimerase